MAFDLPTQTGYGPDDELARGEVGSARRARIESGEDVVVRVNNRHPPRALPRWEA